MIINLNDRYILILDVETANDTTDAIVYDIGGMILDTWTGKICENFSFVIRDTFVYDRALVNQAYYAEKIPEYVNDIRAKKRTMINFMDARGYILNFMKKYNCHTVAAYNCAFDRNALNTTMRYLTKSKYRWFFPFKTKFVCIWNMACSTICQTSEYKTFAETHRFYSNYGKNYRTSAEVVYAFLTNDPSFKEEHKGLDDTIIEKSIFCECLKYNNEVKSIDKFCWQRVERGALALI